MNINLHTAALGETEKQRIRMAMNLLSHQQKNLTMNEWNGWKSEPSCQVVAVNIHEPYGKLVMEMAARRNIPVLVMNGNPPPASMKSTAPIVAISTVMTLVKTLNLLFPETMTRTDPVMSEPASPQESGLLALAHPLFQNRDIQATKGNRSIVLRVSTGRVYAKTLSDLLVARDSFVTGNWTFREASFSEKKDGEISETLASFVLKASLKHAHQLPVFDEKERQLEAWPQLENIPEKTAALQLAMLLQRSPKSRTPLNHEQKKSTTINACMWAFQAAGLFATPYTTHRKSPVNTLFSRIKKWFGRGTLETFTPRPIGVLART